MPVRLEEDFSATDGNLLHWEYLRTSYYYEVLRDQPMLLLPLDETTGTSARDHISSANNGTYTGGFTLGVASDTPILGNTVTTFNGSSGYVDLTASMPNLKPAPVFSIEAWFKTSSATLQTILRHSTSGIGLQVNGATTGAVSAFFYDQGNTQRTVTSTSSYIDGQWHHAVITYDGTTELLYVDGAQVATRTITATGITYGSTGMAIARLGDTSTTFFNGQLSHVALYNTALSAARVLIHYQAGKRTLVSTATAATPTRKHVDLRNFYSTSLSRAFTQLDMRFWNQSHFKLMTQTQLKGGFATYIAEPWTGGTVSKPSGNRYKDTLHVAVTDGGLTTATSTRVLADGVTGADNLLPSVGSAFIELQLTNFPSQSSIAHLDLSNSFVDFSSTASFTAGTTDSIPFSSSTVSLTGGAPATFNAVARFDRALIVNANQSAIAGVRLRLRGATPAAPAAPITAVGAPNGAGPNGTYTYVVTFVSASGEGVAGTPSVALVSGANNVDLSSIPLGPIGTTSRKIYRDSIGVGTYPSGTELDGPATFPAAAGDGIYHLVTTLANNTTTTYTDTATDASIVGAASPPSTSASGGCSFDMTRMRVIDSAYIYDVADIDTKQRTLVKSSPQLFGETLADTAPIFLRSDSLAKHLTEFVKFNTGTFTASYPGSFSFVARYDITTGKSTRIQVVSGSAATTIRTYDNDVLVNTFSGAALTANTDYLAKFDIRGATATTTLYTTQGIFVGNPVMTTGPQTVTSRRGYIGLWFQPYNYDFSVDFVRNSGVQYAQMETTPFQSLTPVIGATLNPKASGRTDILTLNGATWATLSGDGSSATDTSFGMPHPSTKVVRTGASWYGGYETSNYITLGDPSVLHAVGDLYPLNQLRGDYRVALVDEGGAVAFTGRIPNLIANQWTHFEIPISLAIAPSAFKVMIHQLGNFNDTFWIDNFQLLSETIYWEISGDAGTTWMPFLSAIGEKYTAAHFATRGTSLKLRASALTSDAWISGYELIPRYAFPGHQQT